MTNNLAMIKFITREHGLALHLGMGIWDFKPTDAGSLWNSVDGGNSWRQVLGTGYTAFATTSENFVVAAGLDGRFARSTDAGRTWTEDVITIEGNIICLAATSSSNIVIATDVPAILWSADGGKNWRAITLPAHDFDVVDLVTTGPGKLWVLQSPRESAIRTAAYYVWLARSENAGPHENADSDWFSAQRALSNKALCYTSDYGRNWIASDEMPDHYQRNKLVAAGNSVNVAGLGCVIGAEIEGNRIHTWQSPTPMQMFGISERGTVIAGGYSMYGRLSVLNVLEGWRRDFTITDNGIIDADLLDDTYGWAIAGSYGGNTCWGTQNGGATWSRPPRLIIQQGVLGIISPFVDDRSGVEGHRAGL